MCVFCGKAEDFLVWMCCCEEKIAVSFRVKNGTSACEMCLF
jgi:hypothetical protein